MENEDKVVASEPEKELNKEVVTDTYTKEIDIPSQGYLGGPKKITIRAMTAAEEKILYSSRDFSFINKICKACTIKPKDLPMDKLMAQDFLYMIFQIRELTFGSTYLQPIQCPHCGLTQDAEINIADFKYTLLDDNVNEKLFIELPISKLGVHLRILSQQEIDNIESEVTELYRNGKVSDLDGTILMKKISAMVDSIVGVEFENDMDKYAYMNKMHLADFNALRKAINEITFGLDNTVEVTCQNKNCGKKVEVRGTICPEFFRPSI